MNGLVIQAHPKTLKLFCIRVLDCLDATPDIKLIYG